MTQHSFQALLVQASDFKCKLDERTPQFDGVCIARETQRCSNNVVWVGLTPQPRLQGRHGTQLWPSGAVSLQTHCLVEIETS